MLVTLVVTNTQTLARFRFHRTSILSCWYFDQKKASFRILPNDTPHPPPSSRLPYRVRPTPKTPPPSDRPIKTSNDRMNHRIGIGASNKVHDVGQGLVNGAEAFGPVDLLSLPSARAVHHGRRLRGRVIPRLEKQDNRQENTRTQKRENSSKFTSSFKAWNQTRTKYCYR